MSVSVAPKPAEGRLGHAHDDLTRLPEFRRGRSLLKTGALQSAILNSGNFTSIATDECGVIQIFNVGAERMLGYAAAEVLNRISPADLSDPLERAQRAELLSREFDIPIAPGYEALVFKASRGIEDIYELTFIRKDGSRLPAVVSVSALRNVHQVIIGYLFVGTDNTERKRVDAEQARLDAELRESHAQLQCAKDEAERASQAKSEFLSNMSHELRSPLNAILGFAQLIDTGRPLPTLAQKESVDQILHAGWYLLELINEILDLAVIESGRLSLSTEPVSLNELLFDCQSMVEPEARRYGIQVDFERPEGGLFVHADRTRLKQVFVNLLSNAIKYNRTGGSVDVHFDARPDERVRISFQDTGEGLSDDKLTQLFQPFNRLGQEAGIVEGTGIGLSVCKQLVELMGGTIGATSTPGVGSLFWIELGASQDSDSTSVGPHRAAYDSPAETSPGAARRTVLCIEDNPASLRLVARLFERRPDLRLIVARDSRSGIALAQAELPDLILTDINLPGISGLTALGLLATDPATARIPVIAMSANAMPRDIEKGLAAGFHRYLTKPIKVDEFMEALDRALDAKRTEESKAGKMEIGR
jgi:PAS domain S-box-containing protein